MEYVKSWEQPDYPHGEWIGQDEWKNTGIDEVIDKASETYELELEGVDEGYFAIYSENDVGMERIIPMEYSGETFETVRGVFDSNPGVTQRYTPWNTTYSVEGLENDLEAMNGKIVELDDEDIQVIEENFSQGFEDELDVAQVVNSIAGVFWKK